MSTYKIVVAKYKENIDWLNSVRDKCVVYDKSSDYPNVGREAETYLRYIIENYENLPNIVVFTQANISDHLGKNDVSILNILAEQAETYGCSVPAFQPADWPWGPDFNMHTDSNPLYKNPESYHDGKIITYYEYFKNNLRINGFPFPHLVYPNAIFAVKGELIKNHPKSFYESLIATVNHSNWNAEAYFLERAWYYIFNMHKEEHIASTPNGRRGIIKQILNRCG